MSQRFSRKTSAPPLAIYRALRMLNPSPYMFLLNFGEDLDLIGASPEMMVRLEDDIATVRPIAGTRKRGADEADDQRLEKELINDPKERAEHVMLVDLGRNDLGRVCEYGSISVTELCAIQELPTLFHLVSTIQGKLRVDTPPSQILEALFPCGSITGAPKLRTMKIIDELETEPRGLSMGAIGIYIPDGKFGLPGTLDLSVAIRTMVIRDKIATFNVGGGIVIDSDPENEYEESLIKARALLGSIGFEGRLIL
jgi:anthranilate synthase component 1